MEMWKQPAACMFHEGSCQTLNEDTARNHSYCFLSDAGLYPAPASTGGAPADVTTFIIGLVVLEQTLHVNPQWITESLISVHWTCYEMVLFLSIIRAWMSRAQIRKSAFPTSALQRKTLWYHKSWLRTNASRFLTANNCTFVVWNWIHCPFCTVSWFRG